MCCKIKKSCYLTGDQFTVDEEHALLLFSSNTTQLYFILGTAELHWKFPVNLKILLIFTDFQQSTYLTPTSCWKVCEYQSHP